MLTTLVGAACGSFSEADPENEGEATPTEGGTEGGLTAPEAGPGPDGAFPVLDAAVRDGAPPCYTLQDEFARTTALALPWVATALKGDAGLTATAAEGGLLVASVPGATNLSAALVGPVSPATCIARRVTLRFRARAQLPSGAGYFLANELKWPAAAGLATSTLFFRVDATGGAFVYQERSPDAGTATATFAKCTLDDTFRSYEAVLDFTQPAAPWTVTCEGKVNPVIAPLHASHAARPFVVQAGITYTELSAPAWLEIDSLELLGQ